MLVQPTIYELFTGEFPGIWYWLPKAQNWLTVIIYLYREVLT
jgi:hypothetical protein